MAMNNSNDMAKAATLIDSINQSKGAKVKYIKKEQGLIERTEDRKDKIILAEDNRQIIFG
jgi:hypothetical protein